MERVGRALGEEARAQGVGVLLGPGVNIKRSPLCGRNFEYFSEDPLVSGVLGAALSVAAEHAATESAAPTVTVAQHRNDVVEYRRMDPI